MIGTNRNDQVTLSTPTGAGTVLAVVVAVPVIAILASAEDEE